MAARVSASRLRGTLAVDGLYGSDPSWPSVVWPCERVRGIADVAWTAGIVGGAGCDPEAECFSSRVLSKGTVSPDPHPGHSVRRPAYSSLTLSFWPHAEHWILIIVDLSFGNQRGFTCGHMIAWFATD